MKKNKKGFTLIELLAVIVILGVLLAIAIPAVSKYINTAKKSTYKENVQSYAQAAKKEFMNIDSKYELPVNAGDAVAITFKELEHAVENGGRQSSYGNKFQKERSCVIIVNDGTANDPHYTYYIAARDEKGYAIGDGAKTKAIAYDKIQNKNIIQTTDTSIDCGKKETLESDIVEDVKEEFPELTDFSLSTFKTIGLESDDTSNTTNTTTTNNDTTNTTTNTNNDNNNGSGE